MVENSNEIKPSAGYYAAKILNYGLTKTKAGSPEPTIVFEVLEDGNPHRVFWRSSLKDGPAREITLKALAICGFKNLRGFAYLADGIQSGLLDMEKEVQITVEHETNTENGKRYAKVRWINESGGNKFKSAICVSEAAQLMSGMGLEADFMRIAQQYGFKTVNEPIAVIQKQAEAKEDMAIPF